MCLGASPDLAENQPLKRRTTMTIISIVPSRPTIIMIWSSHIETAAAEKENQNNQE
jgi:hypothetical protein